MINKSSLQRSADRVTRYIQQNVTLAGAERREEVLALFDQTQQLFPNWVVMTCPVMHPDILYISSNAADLFGRVATHPSPTTSMEKYFHYVHDADQEDLLACYSYMHDYMEEVAPEEHRNYRVVIHYRFQHADGRYLYLHDEKGTLNLRGSGNLYYALLRDITQERAFGGVRLELFRQDRALVKLREFRPSSERNSLSKREGELVVLMKQGLSTKEIAGYLKISHHTVRNIKSRLFEKFNVSNMIELLNMTA